MLETLRDEPRRLARATAGAGVVLVGSLLLAGASVEALIAALQSNGLSRSAATRTGVTLAGLIPPTAFVALRVRHRGDRGLGALLAGVALVGASAGAFWLTSPSAATIPGPVVATYGVALAALAFGHVAARLGPNEKRHRGETTPSYVREEDDPPVPTDGGQSDDEEFTFPLDDE